MKDTRKVNRERFIRWFADQENGRLARKSLAAMAGVSVSLINQAMVGHLPGEISRLRLCKAMNASENELFPVVQE